MEKLFRNTSVIAAGAIVVAILAPVLAKGLTPAPAPGFAPDDASVGNSRLLIDAVFQYVQDNDENLPPTDTVAHFQAAVSPYLENKSAFTSPVTHLAYQPNPAISGHSLAEFASPNKTVVFQDVKTSGTAKFTVTFLDSHIEQNGQIAGVFNPVQVSASRLKQIGLATLQYVQDNDESFPLLDTPAHAQKALMPYVRSLGVFYSPINGEAYHFNSNMSYATLASLADPSTTVLAQDPTANADGIRAIVYADGHVTPAINNQNNPDDPRKLGDQDAGNLKQIGLGVLQYTQDYDEFFPNFRSESAVEAAVGPYIQQPLIFVNPATGLNYAYNTNMSGIALAQIDSPSELWMARDRTANPDGSVNTLYADGHVKTRYAFIAQHISVGPNNEARLVWNRGDGMVAFSLVSPVGAELSRGQLGQSAGTVKGISTSPTGYTSILIGNGNTASLWTLNPSFYVVQQSNFGPYAGWAPISVASGGNNQPRLLWNRYDKSSAIWQASAANDYLSDKRYALASGDIATGLAVAPDNSQRLVWTRPSGEVRFWTLSAAGDILSQSGVPPYHDWKVKSVTVGPNGNTWVLFAGTGGSSLMTMSPTQQRLNKIDFPAEAGWTPQEVGVGADGYARVLATNVDGRGRLRIYNTAGALLSSHEFAPF
jgi:prepilin-type processing-associated H-X9-DG protein